MFCNVEEPTVAECVRFCQQNLSNFQRGDDDDDDEGKLPCVDNGPLNEGGHGKNAKYYGHFGAGALTPLGPKMQLPCPKEGLVDTLELI